ncbi:MAG TPA: STN domain-containing protein [Steroidobacteraceae bacterium]|nr:STN domain-containing protein [Steroidobacteraceae bacterium]
MLKSLLCVAALSVVWAGVRAAESVKFYLHIASQPLDAALQEFARQSGIQIVFFSKLTEGHQAPALEGEYTADAAMKALLTDSKLTFRVINSKTFQVSPMPVAGADESTPRAPVVGDQKSPRRRSHRAGGGGHQHRRSEPRNLLLRIDGRF